MAAKKRVSSWNSPIMWAGLSMYCALLILFGWQTWQFVNWLFPDDQLLAKILTMISFDILAAFWAVVHTFYRFASRGAKIWVQIAWALTFVLSLIASVLYLVIQFFFRFHLTVSSTMINLGYAVSILALVFNILALMSWLILEHQKRHPRQDEFDVYEQEDDEHSPALPVTQHAKGEQVFTMAQMREAAGKAYDEGLRAPQEKQTSPLAASPLDTTQTRQGSQNGHQN